MTTGKPDFNLNSFGIKYLSKDEVQEFLEKRTQGEKIGEEGQPSLGSGGAGQMTTGGRGSVRTGENATSISGIGHRAHPSLFKDPNKKPVVEKPAVATDSPVTDVNTGNKKLKIPSKKLEGGTRSVFTSRDKLPSKMSNLEASKRRDIESSPKTELNDRGATVQTGNHKVDQSGIVGRQNRQQPQPTTKPNEGVKSRTREQVGGIISDREYSKEGQGKKIYLQSNSRYNKETGRAEKLTESKTRTATGDKNTNSEGKKKKEHKMAKRTTKLDSKQESNTAGDAPEGVKTETQNIGGSNIEVGVGTDAHKKLQEDNVGGLRRAQRVRSGTGHEGKNIGRGKGERKDSNLNEQSKTSKNAKAHDTRGKKYIWENDEDKAVYNNIKQVKHSKTGEMVNDRNAQRKYLNSMDEKYKRSVTEQPKISTAGQKIIDEMSKKKKKSNDIILDMNILKLDLMGNKKDDVFSPRSADVGKRQGKKQGKNQVRTQIEETAPQITNTLSHNILNNMKYRTDEDKKENNIEKTAAETIFKAISLKLDLTKTLK